MKKLILVVLMIFIPSCKTNFDNPTTTAQNFIGLNEHQNRTVLKHLVGVDPVRVEWCAAFVNAILQISDIPNLYDIQTVNPLAARNFLEWGEAIKPEDIQLGDIVIFPRGDNNWQGHVGFFVEEQEGRWVILGGNQANSVRYDFYKPSRALGIRRWIK